MTGERTSASHAGRSALLALALGAPSGCLAPRDASSPAVTLAPLVALAVEVGAFTLPLMTDACFAVTVYATADPEALVPANVAWSATDLCASTHGAPPELALAVVAGCNPDAPGEGHPHTVRLELSALYLGGPAGDIGAVLSPDYYANPCRPGTDDCLLTVACDAVGDGDLRFDLAVAAHPDLGVFDTRVVLGEVYCAARLDCADHGGQPLSHLPDPTTGLDGPTAALRLACHAADTTSTWLYLDDLTVTCTIDGVTTRSAQVDPSGGPGPVDPDGPDPPLFGAAIHLGVASAALSWQVLLGLRLDGPVGETCALTARGAASGASLDAGETAYGARFPVIRWHAPLWSVGENGPVLICGRHALGGPDGVVVTAYTPLDTPTCFAHELASGPGASGAVTTFSCP